MVDFLPFQGLVPELTAGEHIAERISPPYDVIGEEEKRRLQSNHHNVTRITLGAKECKYDEAAKELATWIKEGSLRRTKKACYYLYRQSFEFRGERRTRTGIMGRLKLESYGKGNIMPHEETFPKIKEDRLNLLRATSAHLESIFGIYDEMDLGTRDLLLNIKEAFHFVDASGVSHSFCIIREKKVIMQLNALFAAKQVLIADGHHRYETALQYSQENPQDKEKGFVLATLVGSDDPGLLVEPTHRLLQDIGMPVDQFMTAIVKDFGIWEMRSAAELATAMERSKRVMLGALLPDGRIFALEHLEAPDDNPLWSVDTFVCEELVVKPILSALPPDKPARIEYDHDLGSVRKKMETGTYAIAIVLSPPKLETIWEMARSGKKMPKKSTYFYPKVWSGFVIMPMT